MSLYLKSIKEAEQDMFLYFPGEDQHSPFKVSAVTFLLDHVDEELVHDLLENQGLAKLADVNRLILAFPVPPEGGWDTTEPAVLESRIKLYSLIQDKLNARVDVEMNFNQHRIPTFESMMGVWHPMNDVRYLVGEGSGASLALSLAACSPENIAGVLAVHGALHPEAQEKAVNAPIPIILADCDAAAEGYFRAANHTDVQEGGRFFCEHNPCQSVTRLSGVSALDGMLVCFAWDTLLRGVRRTNTGSHGDCERRLDLDTAGFELVIDNDKLLGDGIAHTWFIHVPEIVRANPRRRVPMMMFFHGGSDNPAEAAEMSKFHELGEREGFITVYPWGTNRCSWNIHLSAGEPDDIDYTVRLIDYMIAHYPADESRVYLSGFSNGAGHALAMGLMHPERVAAICPIDSNWPGQRFGYAEVDPKDVPVFSAAMLRKQEHDWRIPTWYTYGTREPSYPVYKGCSQQHQYDFFKWFNNIPVKPTPDMTRRDPCGCGVPGDVQEHLQPSVRHPHHDYDVQRFFSKDDVPMNLYNYVIMRDKGHDVAQMDPELGWRYVRHFRREKDGSVSLI